MGENKLPLKQLFPLSVDPLRTAFKEGKQEVTKIVSICKRKIIIDKLMNK